jgi:hypothetical protein
MQLPDYLIIGECKCGTTSLYSYLVQHPDILDTYGNPHFPYLGTKELRFFDRSWAEGLEWYKELFPTTEAHQITGEASPQYFFRASALDRIRRVLPDAKLILLLRNPVDRLYSHYHHVKRWVPEWEKAYGSFRKYWEAAKESDYYLIDKGIYVDTLCRWQKYYSKDQLLVLCSETLRAKTSVTYQKVLAFLDMPVHELSEIKFLRSNPYSLMSENLKAEISAFYQPYNQRLYDVLGYSMGWE